MTKVIVKNKEAHYNFELLTKYEAGLVLLGWEVKSIRASKVQLKNAFVSFKNNEAYLSGMHVSQYMQVAGDEMRPRKLLLHQSELRKIKIAMRDRGVTAIPLTLKWSSKGHVKVDIAVARGKSKLDKREVIKKRDISRKLRTYL